MLVRLLLLYYIYSLLASTHLPDQCIGTSHSLPLLSEQENNVQLRLAKRSCSCVLISDIITLTTWELYLNDFYGVSFMVF